MNKSAEIDLPSYRPSGVFENDGKLEITQHLTARISATTTTLSDRHDNRVSSNEAELIIFLDQPLLIDGRPRRSEIDDDLLEISRAKLALRSHVCLALQSWGAANNSLKPLAGSKVINGWDEQREIVQPKNRSKR